MLKNLLLFFLVVLSMACNGIESNKNNSVKKDSLILENYSKKFKEEFPISPRDYSIDTTNSYSHFFLDSLTVDKFIKNAQFSPSLGNRIIGFYNKRNYQFAWFSNDGPTEQGRGFWNMYSYYLQNENSKVISDSNLVTQMNRYMDDKSFDWHFKNKDLIATEMLLTKHFISYALKNYEQWFVDGTELEKFVPAKKMASHKFAEKLLRSDNNFDVNNAYTQLKLELIKYLNIKKQGGWPAVTSFSKETNPQNFLLKKRLFLSGDLPVLDSSNLFTDSLKQAVKNFQTRHGYNASGTLSKNQLAELNIKVEDRIEQLLINMSRALWFVSKPQGKIINVNIPAFELHISENDSIILNMNVVVGKEGSKTTMFTGNMNRIVFSPYWNVPLSITKNEVVPGIRRSGQGYLNRQNMEVVGSWGNGLPKVRQKPGGRNALGKIKFLFPNNYDIYFHDTPSKSLFKNDKRAYSHGCIRLSDPKKLATYLLQSDTSFTDYKIDSFMNAKVERGVRLKPSIPVVISYYTAWVDDAGKLHFANDVYGNDKALAKKMFSLTKNN